MGILRSIGKYIFGLIFALSLSGLIVTIGLVQFTEYENMKMVFSEIVTPQIEGRIGNTGQISGENGQSMEDLYQYLLSMCEGKDSVQVPVPQSEPITIDCNKVRESQGGEEAVKEIIGDAAMKSMFDSIYYKRYECDFVTCLQTGQVGIVLSEQGHEFLRQLQLYLVVAVVVSGVLVVILAENWPGRLKGIGWPTVSTGVSYIILEFGKGIIASMLPSEEQTGINVMPIVEKLVGPMMNNFLIALVVGVVLTACGYALAYKEKRKIENRKGIRDKK